uniref:Uncharacterized protein n=1 Tax=Romanomermis culicivorax TaxID=13658 RepID=A0A915J4S6_ROMCU
MTIVLSSSDENQLRMDECKRQALDQITQTDTVYSICSRFANCCYQKCLPIPYAWKCRGSFSDRLLSFKPFLGNSRWAWLTLSSSSERYGTLPPIPFRGLTSAVLNDEGPLPLLLTSTESTGSSPFAPNLRSSSPCTMRA